MMTLPAVRALQFLFSTLRPDSRPGSKDPATRPGVTQSLLVNSIVQMAQAENADKALCNNCRQTLLQSAMALNGVTKTAPAELGASGSQFFGDLSWPKGEYGAAPRFNSGRLGPL